MPPIGDELMPFLESQLPAPKEHIPTANPSHGGSVWRTILRAPLPLQRESSLFLVVSVLDVMMTSILLSNSFGIEGRINFYESNPIARFFLERWEVRGI